MGIFIFFRLHHILDLLFDVRVSAVSEQHELLLDLRNLSILRLQVSLQMFYFFRLIFGSVCLRLDLLNDLPPLSNFLIFRLKLSD